ncbi:MAG: hypothetical protein QJR12_17070 [Mycobacterium sp.]|uniref:hypothetical protein n=1 Tax=Mycobacterium sp. TaxID=1785 RepID=UPI002604964A|nr:hypothetical protein [Mycobacterium sp.]MDI3315920.1 hypothetical protein [Mycobacterium sp.]
MTYAPNGETANQPRRAWRSALRWPYTRRGTIVLGSVALLIAIVALYEFINAGGAIFIIGAVFIFTMVIVEWVKLYRHRGDPDWPRRPPWVPSDEPQPGNAGKP